MIIGSGIAGLTFALQAAEHGSVFIITKKKESDSNTNYAQGGIASVIDINDSFNQHIADTITAGAGLCNKNAVDLVVKEGPKAIQRLINWGVQFTKTKEGKLSLVKEGGHSSHRIAHSDDLTGKEIERALVLAVHNHPNITIFTDHYAIDFITDHQLSGKYDSEHQQCYGAYVFDSKKKQVHLFLADTTVICSGGIGQLYLHTTNPEIATADGIAMAFRAGCEIENLEFVQFHPTSLYRSDAEKNGISFLISEAVRGFGGILRNHDGEAFMLRYDERGDLAPRDIVARAIDSEMKKSLKSHVWLDLTHKKSDEIKSHFPNIYKTCKSLKIDITNEFIPVVPSAHYSCGGIKTDLHGRTRLNRLYACGEVASTGLHGANRLASNSLLEAVVFSSEIYKDILIRKFTSTKNLDIPEWENDNKHHTEKWDIIAHDKKLIQQIMWDFVGIIRSRFKLKRAMRRLNMLYLEIEDYYKRSIIFPELLELRNITTSAYLVVRCSLMRKESRGLHYVDDFPILDKTIIKNSTLRSSRFLGDQNGI